MTKKVARQNIHVAGIPGSGKTEYCRWLEREKGFLHLDFDELLDGRGTPVKLALTQRLCSVKHIGQALSEQQQPIAIDWGFPPACLSSVELFKANGVSIWWFDGDRDAARDAFVQRNTPGRTLEHFNVQMEAIEGHWPRIQEAFGQDIIFSVSPGPTHASPESIYRKMFRK